MNLSYNPPSPPKVSKRWQKYNPFFLNLTMALIAVTVFFWLDSDYPVPLKITFIAVSTLITLILGRAIFYRTNSSVAKVFTLDFDTVVRLVQVALKNGRIPFSKRMGREDLCFQFKGQCVKMELEAFSLNLPIDDHLSSIEATKITLFGLNQGNQAFAQQLCEVVDAAFAYRPQLQRTYRTGLSRSRRG